MFAILCLGDPEDMHADLCFLPQWRYRMSVKLSLPKHGLKYLVINDC